MFTCTFRFIRGWLMHFMRSYFSFSRCFIQNNVLKLLLTTCTHEMFHFVNIILIFHINTLNFHPNPYFTYKCVLAKKNTTFAYKYKLMNTGRLRYNTVLSCFWYLYLIIVIFLIFSIILILCTLCS